MLLLLLNTLLPWRHLVRLRNLLNTFDLLMIGRLRRINMAVRRLLRHASWILATRHFTKKLLRGCMTSQLWNTVHLLPIIQFDIKIINVDADRADIIYVTDEIAGCVSVIWRYCYLGELLLLLSIQMIC